MPLSREEIISKELEYFKSELAREPAFISLEFDEDYEGGNNDEKCVYKTEDGRKCAVGALIKPALYNPKIDDGNGMHVSMLPDPITNYLGRTNIDWLSKLQECHDELARNWEYEPDQSHFGREFLRIAKEKGLLS